MDRKKESNTPNNGGNWNHLKIIQKISEQNTGKARNQGTAENSNIGRCTHTSESTNVKVQNIQHGIVTLPAVKPVNTE